MRNNERKSSTILKFFGSPQKFYEIPVYQRAYSWEESNWRTFLDDLLEYTQGGNNYFFGNLLLEVIDEGKKYEIIDGQQRITTLSIFMRSLLNVLKSRKDSPELSEVDFEEKTNIYFKSGRNIKLRPVEYDRAYFDALIVDNESKFSVSTDSQSRIKAAKEYFEKELGQFDTSKIIKILKKTEDTELTIIEMEGKKESALMFELENNRGKELTDMEKIKSYFMYQMYVYSIPAEAETDIEGISDKFKFIYLMVNKLKLNEDSILIYHNNAYINGFAYRTLDDVKDVFKKQKQEDKVVWIKEYIRELKTTFLNMQKFQISEDKFAQRLKDLRVPAYIYPFIIKGYKYFGEDEKKLNMLFHLLEIITFRAKLVRSRANIQVRLNPILLEFTGNFVELLDDINNKLNEPTSWHWNDTNIKNHLNGFMYGNNVLEYVLWQYEVLIQNQGYSIIKFPIKKEQFIEHISPQSLNDRADRNRGYEVGDNNQYSEDFISNKLNCIGNLMLISGLHNVSKENKLFNEKLSTYKSNPQSNQQAEIVNFVKYEGGQPVWKSESIDERRKKIVEFSIYNWSFDRINTK